MTDINHDEINQQQLFPDANEANTAEQDQPSLYGPADGVTDVEYTKVDSIPHSGNLGLEKPVKEFDTHLGVAHEKGLITPLKIEEDPRNPEDKKKMSLGKKIGAFTAAVVLAGGAAFVAKGLAGSGDNTPEAAPVPAENTTDEVVEGPSNPVEVEEDPAEKEPTTPNNPELGEQERIEPVLMTATTPQGLLDELSHNLECAAQNTVYEDQSRCLEYIVAGSDGGELTTWLYTGLGYINEEKAFNPEYEFFFDATVLDSESNGSEMIIAAEVTDPAGTYYMRYRFVRAVASIEGLSAQDQTREVWRLQRQEALTEGEVNFS